MKIRFLVGVAAAIVIVLLATGLLVIQTGMHAGLFKAGAQDETSRPSFALGGHPSGASSYPMYDYGIWSNPYLGYSYGYGAYGPGVAFFDSIAPTAKDVQQALTKGGYYHGPIDGILNASTKAAISAYQREKGLPVTGNIDAKLLSSLGLE